MKRADIIRLLREAGLEKYHLPDSMMEYDFDRCIFLFSSLVAAAERERCAKIADAHASIEGIAQTIAAEIRSNK